MFLRKKSSSSSWSRYKRFRTSTGNSDLWRWISTIWK